MNKCPHGWTNCPDCLHFNKCRFGLYTPELDEDELKVDLGEPIIEIEKPEPKQENKGTWAERFMRMGHSKALEEIYKYHSDNLSIADPYKHEVGAIVPGGSKNGKRRKQPKKKMPEYLKTFGQKA